MAEHTHDHDHAPGLQHQFDDMGQQVDSVTVGMWAFLVQEIMFFGGLFTAYLVFRSKYPMAFAAGSNELDAFWGFVNTLVLIVSSLTMALGVYFAQKGNRNMQVIMIVLTMLFGCTFLGVKAIEYTDKYVHGHIPVDGWNKIIPEGENSEHAGLAVSFETRVSAAEEGAKEEGAGAKEHPNPRGEFLIDEKAARELIREAEDGGFLTPSEKAGYYRIYNDQTKIVDIEKFEDRVQMFFWIYFVMTGLHALHMIIGLGIMTWLLIMAWRGTFSGEYYSPVEISGLYWHFVDIVWIFLFPLLYLLGRHFEA